jgi:hypothetical protein
MNGELFKAWLAGFFDGEGSVCFTNAQNAPNTPRVSLYQKGQLDLLIEIQKQYGGTIQLIKRSGVHGLHLQGAGDVSKFLQDVLPYLRVKKQKAELMLAFCVINVVGANPNNLLKEQVLRHRYAEAFRSLTEDDQKEVQ